MAMQHQAIHTRFAHLDRKWVRDAMSRIEAGRAEINTFRKLQKLEDSLNREILILCMQAETALTDFLSSLEKIENYIAENERATTEDEKARTAENYASAFGHVIRAIESFDEAIKKIKQKEQQLEGAEEKQSQDISMVKSTIEKLKRAERDHINQMLTDLRISRSEFKQVYKELGW